ncbi:MAG: hypothetical protein OEV62_00120 [Actinomycetota bacterium]|nr:hypothetical protein [Actinomycetota bacterium]
MPDLLTIYGVWSGGGGAPPAIAALDAAPPQWTLVIENPRIDRSADVNHRWVQDGWDSVTLDIQPSEGDSAQVQWAVNAPGQVRVEVDRWRYAELWDEGAFTGIDADYRSFVPEAFTMWLFRGSALVWAGFLRDIDGDTTQPTIVLTGEEFTSAWQDIMLTADLSWTGGVLATLDDVLNREFNSCWMRTYQHAGALGTLDFSTTIRDTRRINEVVDALSIAGPFEWQQWLGRNVTYACNEALVSVHPGKAGADYSASGLTIEWGSGTSESAHTARYTLSTRSTRTRAFVMGAGETYEMWGYNDPLNVPRRDLVYRDDDLPDTLVSATAQEFVRRRGLPMFSARVTLRVGDFAGGWPFLWIEDPAGGGGCSPVGSRFYTRVVDAGMIYQGIMRASTWGVSIGPTGEYMVLDLTQDEGIIDNLPEPIPVYQYL